MITAIYVGILALFQIFLTAQVIRLRIGRRVAFGANGHTDLQRAIRAHGNFIETVPLAVILIGLAEFCDGPLWAVHVMGALLVIGRVLHYIGLTKGKGYGKIRVAGMAMTLSVYLIGGILAILLGLQA